MCEQQTANYFLIEKLDVQGKKNFQPCLLIEIPDDKSGGYVELGKLKRRK